MLLSGGSGNRNSLDGDGCFACSCLNVDSFCGAKVSEDERILTASLMSPSATLHSTRLDRVIGFFLARFVKTNFGSVMFLFTRVARDTLLIFSGTRSEV